MDLTLMLYDDNRGKFKELIGRAKIKIKSILQSGECWVEMKKKNGESVLGQNKKTTRVKISVDQWTQKNHTALDHNQISPLELTNFVQFLEDEEWTFRFRVTRVGYLCCRLWEGIAPDCYVETMFVNQAGKRLRVPKNEDIQTLQLLLAFKSSSMLRLTKSSDLGPSKLLRQASDNRAGLTKANLFQVYFESKSKPKIDLDLHAFENGFRLLDNHGVPITVTLETIFTKAETRFTSSRARLSISLREHGEFLDQLKDLEEQIQRLSQREYKVQEMLQELEEDSLVLSFNKVADMLRPDSMNTDVAAGSSQRDILLAMSASLFFVLLYSLFPRP
ncbi:hypothetical protein GUITHDRAFT_138441 [Guillardia theta CCMP2712]|uniref:Uncharacterized protein n=1 Tax=Guillardia theta (strain CCMP2712) TaxID=905079 RepID=L1JCW5_GUITC|nr:hypothetical protein GUITHDRAFT_138441 [Guillardia theta CCMP2712]EKX45945.1 hypothetical protein GUITHDRAFT_138441 [Guillardia theta CCMP2712]|eukprot:XP_005832925.1 hypothetical protein GUITHDRAFT_138441 [Guillardia theta CCMP2712]